MSRSTRLFLPILLILLLGTAALIPATARTTSSGDSEGACVDSGQPNLLLNPSFEGEYQVYDPPGGIPQCPNGPCTSVRTASDWSPWWRQGSTPLYYKMPEFTAADETTRWYGPPRARTGERAQQYFTLYSTHEAGVYQQVTVEAGMTYCFSAWGHAWTANDDPIPEKNHDSCPSPQGVGDACSGPEDGQLRQKIGIDPTGGTDWSSPDIIWSDQEIDPNGRIQYDSFGLFVVTATAQAETITVFTYGQPEHPVKHNNTYWDDATLSTTGQMVVDNGGVGLATMTTAAAPVAVSRAYTVSLIGFPSGTWNAVVTADPGLLPTLNRTSGGDGDVLTIGIDTAGLPLGSYSGEVTISAAAAIPGSPVRVPLQVYVVETIHRAYLPLVHR